MDRDEKVNNFVPAVKMLSRKCNKITVLTSWMILSGRIKNLD
jgi:hypothetical protein